MYVAFRWQRQQQQQQQRWIMLILKKHPCTRMHSFRDLTRVVLQHVLEQVQGGWRRCWQDLCPGFCLCWGKCQLAKVWKLSCSRPPKGVDGAQHRAQATQLVYV